MRVAGNARDASRVQTAGESNFARGAGGCHGEARCWLPGLALSPLRENVSLACCFPEWLLRGEIAHDAIIMANRLAGLRRRIPLLYVALVVAMAAPAARAQSRPPADQGVSQLEADQQRRVGQV